MRAESGLARADRRRLRVGVDHPGHRVVAGLPRLAEDVGGDDLALVLADVGQRPDAGDVADRPEPSPTRRRASTGTPCGAGLDPDASRGRSPRPGAAGRSRPAAGRPSARGRRRARARSPRRRAGPRPRWPPSTSSIPSARSTSPSASPSGAGSRAEQVLGALDDHRLAAEPPHRLGHLDPDRAAAEHQQPARDRLHRRSPRGWSRRRRARAGPGAAG